MLPSTSSFSLSPLHKVFIQIFRFPHKCGFLPISYNKTTERFQKTLSYWRNLFYKIFVYLIALDNMYITYFMLFHDTSYMTTQEYYDVLIHTVSRSLGDLFDMMVVLELEQFVYFLNTLLYLDHNLQGN